MVSVRRVVPILLLAVTVPVWAQTTTSTTSTATTTTQKKTTKKAATPAAASTTTATTTSAPPATTSAAATTTTTSSTTKKTTTTKKAAAKTKKAKATTAKMKEAAPAEKKPAAKTAAKAPAKSTHPPRELHKVGDHWTPYNPPDPASYPPGAKTYTIKAGDTLWALGKQFYNNAYLWPQIWEANTWITDAHWIYPGDVLLIEGEIAQQATTGTAGTTGTTVAGGETATGQPGTQPGTGTPLGAPSQFRYITAADAVGGSTGPVALATEKDLYCYGYIGDPDEPLPNSIVEWEDVEVRYQPGAVKQEIDGSEGDLVFIDGGTSTGLAAGETYMVVVPRALIPHPVTKEVLGREYEYRGQIRILCADATKSRAIVTQSCAEIPIGGRLKPMPQIPIPLARIPNLPAFCDPASGKPNGYLVAAQGGAFLEILGEGQLVQINLGRDDQVQPGEFLTVFRQTNLGRTERQVLGEIAVLTAESHTATARIVLMRRAMRIGDQVEVR
jgi:hypothetical protein